MEIGSLGVAEGIKMKNCPTCLRPFEKMLDYPSITLDKVEIPEQSITTYPGCASVNADAIWKTVKNQSPAFMNYLNTLSRCAGKAFDPTDLLPGWPADEYFKYAYAIYDDKVERLRIEHKFLYVIFEQAEEGDICNVELLQTGPNFGSAGGDRRNYRDATLYS